MTPFLKIAERIDVLPLALSLTRQPELFNQNPERLRAGSPHAQASDIWVRFNDRANVDLNPAAACDEHTSVWYPAAGALPEVRSIVFPLMARVEGEQLGGILITKLPPGAEIRSHVDRGWHAGFYEKFHVAVQNDHGCVFGFEGGDMLARAGDVHWFRNDIPHWVRNDSKRDRLSMIVCIRTNRGLA